MATRYWRGGTGSWTNANTNNWAASANACTFTASRSTTVLTVTAVSSGAIAVGMTVWHTTNTAIGTITAFGTGTGGVGTYIMSASGTLTSRTMSSATIGASAPTSSDPVVFDADSNVGTAAFTVTTSTGAACGGMSVSGLDGTMTWAGTTAMTISGSLLLPTSNFTRTYTGALTFNTTGTITSNGVSFANALTFNGSGQTFTLGSALTTTAATTFTAGSISLQTFTLSALTFSSSNTNTRSIDFGTGKISVTGTTGTVWNMADWTNFTVSGTPLLQKPNAGGTISHGPSNGPFDYTKTISVNVSVSTTYIGQFRDFQAGGAITLTTVLHVFGNLTINASSTFSSSSSFALRGGPTGTSSQSITTNNVSLDQLYQFSNNSITVLNDSLTVRSLSAALDTQGNTVNATTMVLTLGSFLRTSTLTVQTVGVYPGIDPGTSKIILQGGVNDCSITSYGTLGVSPTTLLYDVELNPTVASTGTLISGDLSFNKIYSRTTVQHYLTLYLDSEVGGQQYFVTNFDASGTASGQLNLGGYGGGTIITQTSGTVNLSYVTINSIIATGGATWNAFTSNGNIDGGNNTGWNFTAPVVTNVEVQIVGVTTTTSIGSVVITASATTILDSVSTTCVVGNTTVVANSTTAITGVSATASVGDVVVVAKANTIITGVSSTVGAGDVTIVAKAVTSITGVTSTFTIGDIGATNNVIFTFDGISFTAFIGSANVTTTVFDYNAVSSLYSKSRTIYVERQDSSKERTVSIATEDRKVYIDFKSTPYTRTADVSTEVRKSYIYRKSSSKERTVSVATEDRKVYVDFKSTPYTRTADVSTEDRKVYVDFKSTPYTRTADVSTEVRKAYIYRKSSSSDRSALVA